MSSSEGDIDDELLALAGATDRKRKNHQQSNGSASKRRKADASAESDSDAPHAGSEGAEEEANPYPFEGKYIDEGDKQRLLAMSEIEREAELAQRQEELQRFTDKRQLEQLLKLQGGRAAEDSVSKAAKRQHAVRGATKEKSKKLDELKAKRKAKDEKKRTKGNSPKRDRSSSPMEMETDDEEEEDGQISKLEQEEERDRKLFSKPDDDPMTVEGLQSCLLSRTQLLKYCMTPWFGEYVKGAWVRYLIGSDNNTEGVYRICQIVELVPSPRTYQVDGKTLDQQFRLKHGEAEKVWPMDKVSNSPILPKEWERLVQTHKMVELRLPSMREVEKKAAQMREIVNKPMTESDVSAMLARRNAIDPSKRAPSTLEITMERSRLSQMRTLALRRNDRQELADIDEKLAALPQPRDNSVADKLARVNERNRKANAEAVRKAELHEAERKRQRRLNLGGGSATPTPGTPDTAASRFKAKMLDSRSGTPASLANGGDTPRSVSPLPPSSLGDGPASIPQTFEASMLQSVEIDLGDF